MLFMSLHLVITLIFHILHLSQAVLHWNHVRENGDRSSKLSVILGHMVVGVIKSDT